MLILENKDPPMRKLIQPWKLCRSFGSQPVGSSANSTWPEAGIAAQVIPAQPSYWTFNGKGDVHCRPAWRMTTGVATRSLSAGRSSGASSILKHSGRGYRYEAILQTTAALPRPSNCPNLSRNVTGSLNLFNSPFPDGNRDEPQNTYCYQETRLSVFSPRAPYAVKNRQCTFSY